MDKEEKALLGFALVLALFGLVISVALFIGALYALIVWGIIDLIAVGPNFWNIFWIVLSGIYILSSVSFTARK